MIVAKQPSSLLMLHGLDCVQQSALSVAALAGL